MHAAVRQRGDRAVGEDVDGAFLVAQDRRPQVDRLDQAAGAVDRDDVADADLVLEDEEEAADQVA